MNFFLKFKHKSLYFRLLICFIVCALKFVCLGLFSLIQNFDIDEFSLHDGKSKYLFFFVFLKLILSYLRKLSIIVVYSRKCDIKRIPELKKKNKKKTIHAQIRCLQMRKLCNTILDNFECGKLLFYYLNSHRSIHSAYKIYFSFTNFN